MIAFVTLSIIATNATDGARDIINDDSESHATVYVDAPISESFSLMSQKGRGLGSQEVRLEARLL